MILKKIWNFLWNEDSLSSWIVNIVLAFLIIKFLVYPVLGSMLGTGFPIVAVVSGSMEHQLEPLEGKYEICGSIFNESERLNFDRFWNLCGPWYQNRNITKKQFEKFKLSNGFNKGDIIVLQNKKDINVGDTIVFWSNYKNPIIHRVVEIKENKYNTKGDHNYREDGFVHDDKVLGKALFKIPLLGWIKIWFVNIFKIPLSLFKG